MIDKLLFNLRPWQMFLITLAVVMLNGVLFFREPGWRGIVGDLLPGSLFTLCMLLLGSRLRGKLSDHYSVHYLIFRVSGIILIVTLVLVSFYREEIPLFFETKGPLLIFLIIIFFAMGFAFIGFIARAMKSLETNDQATVADYAGDVFLWGVWCVGVWILGPRLNRLYDRFYSK